MHSSSEYEDSLSGAVWDRDIDRVLPAANPERAVVMATLAFLAVSRAEWTRGDLKELIDSVEEVAEHDEDLRTLVQRELPAGFADVDAVRSALDRAGALLVQSDAAGAQAAGLGFADAGLRDRLIDRARDEGLLHALEALWGLLADQTFNGNSVTARASGELRQRLLAYAVAQGPQHLLRAAERLPSLWARGVDRLLDLRPGIERAGYLRLLLEPAARRQGDAPAGVPGEQAADGWSTLREGIVLALGLQRTHSDHERVTLLRSLRHVLADQHSLVAEGTLPLAAALFNRMAGRWTGGTPWGDRLRACAEAIRAPWLRTVDPPASAALGPMTHHLVNGPTCFAATPDGEYFAVGANGETRVWTREDLINGLDGFVATRHRGGVCSVALISGAGAEPWWLASGGVDGTARIVSSSECEGPGRDDGERLLGRVATRQGDIVNSVALLPGSGGERWWLASCGNDHTARIVSASECEEPGRDDGERLLGRVATRHGGWVHSVALLPGSSGERWWLASCGNDHTARIVSASECEEPGRDDGERPLGRVATRHGDIVTHVALPPGSGGEHWWMASCGYDRTARIVSVRISANVTGDFGNVTDLGLGAELRD